MKPFIKYPGGKIKEYPLVDRFKPKAIKRYFEPFVGGASIYLNLGIEDSYINDISEDLANLYQYVKKQNRQFFLYLKVLDALWKSIEVNFVISTLFPHGNFSKYMEQALTRKEQKINSLEEKGTPISQEDKNDLFITAKKTAFYMCIRDIYNQKDIEQTLRTACFYFIREYCYSSMFRFSKDGKFNVPYGGRSYNFKYMTEKIKQMQSAEIKQKFKKTSIYNLDFEKFLNLFDLNEQDFLFLDPPYDSDFSTYDNHLFDKKEQTRLSDFLKKTKAKWLLIIKKTSFVYELYKDFYIFEYDKNYLVSFKNRNVKNAKHLLITNYEIEE